MVITHYKLEEMIWIERNGCKVLICPECKKHKQGNHKCLDCKNTYSVGNDLCQCNCYSKEHGLRGE